MRVTRACWSLVPALLIGCSSGPSAPEATQQGLYRWDTRQDPSDVQALRERIGPYLGPGGGACLATLFRDRVDLAQALILEEPPGPRHDDLVRALPEGERADDAAMREGEATLEAAAKALEAGTQPALPSQPLPTASLRARAAYLELGAAWRADAVSADLVERAIKLAPADWVATQRIEAMRALSAFTLPDPQTRAWRRRVAELALKRGRPLVALDHATGARALAQRPAELVQDGALIGRVHLTLGQGEAALLEAEVALKQASGPAERMQLEELSGQAMLLLGQPKDAAGAFGRAQQAAVEARDEAGAVRQAVNRATAWMKAGDALKAKEATADVQALSLSPTGPEAPELQGRRAIVAALAAMATGELDPIQTAQKVESALEQARAAGAVMVVEVYSGLPERLRRGRGQ